MLALVILLGPRARVVEAWVEPELPPDLEAYLARAEADVPDVRAGDERAVVWSNPATQARTEISLVYLHGFSADRHEVEPLVSRLADSLDANVYFARLRGHGRNGAAMAEATAEAWLADAAEAVAIGDRIGARVVLVGTSTGATLAFWAQARAESAGRVAATVLISPNFHPADRSARLLLWPWGGLLARLAIGPERCFEPGSAEQARHWTTCYPTSALLPMMALVEHVRTSASIEATVPTLVLYARGDRVVDASETERVVARLDGTRLEVAPWEGAGDPQQHVLAGDILSPEGTDAVAARILAFLRRAGVAAP